MDLTARYKTHAIRKSGGRKRIIHAPDDELKTAQRLYLMNEYRNGVGPGPYAFGFVRKKGIRDHASAHVGRQYVVRIDIKDFFPSVRPEHVFDVWKVLENFSDDELVNRSTVPQTAAVENIPPPMGIIDLAFIKIKDGRGLPQGSPLSPYMANLAMKPIDFKVRKMLTNYGPDDARYTRYADDLILSSNHPSIQAMARPVRVILERHNFKENRLKFRVMRRSMSQRVCGVVVNEKLNIPSKKRNEYRGRIYRLFKQATTGQSQDGYPIDNWEPVVTEYKHVCGYASFMQYINPELYGKYKIRLDVTRAILQSRSLI